MYHRVPEVLFAKPLIWLQSFIIPTILLMPELAIRHFRRRYSPQLIDFIQEAEILYKGAKRREMLQSLQSDSPAMPVKDTLVATSPAGGSPDSLLRVRDIT